jgi:hypothetical protein
MSTGNVRQHIPSSMAITPRLGLKVRNPGLMSPRSVESPNREFGKDLVSTKPSYETSGMNSGVRTGSKTVRKINLDARDGGVPVLVRHKSVDDWYISKLDCMLYSAMFVHVHPKKQV